MHVAFHGHARKIVAFEGDAFRLQGLDYIGDAVADLSQVCEALPQLFESKLASIRADVAANVAGLREALAESGE